MAISNKQYIVVKSQYVLPILQYIAIRFWRIVTALEIITCDPSIYTMDYSKRIVSNQKEESIST